MDAYGRIRCALTLVVLTSVCGCAAGRNIELLESRLRSSQDRLFELERQLTEAQNEARSARDELVVAREQAAKKGRSLAVGPQPASLAFSSLLTGGIDEDGVDGDEAVRAIIQPVSDDGLPVRAVGTLHVELLDVAAPPEKRTRGRWSYSGEQLRELWRSGLFSTGYELALAPSDGRLPEGALLLARFVTPEGEQLEATQTVQLRPTNVATYSTQDGPIRTVSAEALGPPQAASPLSDADILRDFPRELPKREPPADVETANPFAEFVPSEQTSDSFTKTDSPAFR